MELFFKKKKKKVFDILLTDTNETYLKFRSKKISQFVNMGTDIQGDDWEFSCSEDELTKCGIFIGKEWMPDPVELEELYKNIDKNGTLSLEWKCPGRRAPSPIPVSKENQPEISTSPIREEKSDFDFMDEVSSLRLRVRREGEDTLRGSAKKKTTSFDGILSNMIRHKRIEQLEKQSITPASNKQPNNAS